MLLSTIIIMQWIILYYLIITSFCYIVLLFLSTQDIFLKFKESRLAKIPDMMKSNSLPPVTIIIPAYQEEDMIIEAVKSVLNNDYLNTYLIVINDGSTDKTLQKLIDEFQFYVVPSFYKDDIPVYGKTKEVYLSKIHKKLSLIDKEHTDKSDSLNVGINACISPLFITVDADTLLEPDAISRLIFYFLSLSHPVAAGGGIYILNGCTYENGIISKAKFSLKPIQAFQTCEYLRSFLFSRSGWNAFGGALCYSGALTLLNRHEVVKIGGFDAENKALDFEIIVHLHEYERQKKLPYRIHYTPAAIAWTDVPSTLLEYWHQRFNWQYYSLRSLLLHKKMLFNPKYGIVGMFTYPFYLLGEIFGAVVEFFAYFIVLLNWLLGRMDLYWVILFFILCIGFSIFLTVATALMGVISFDRYHNKSNLLYFLIFSVLENFGFRQYNMICRFAATLKYAWDALLSYYTKFFVSSRKDTKNL